MTLNLNPHQKIFEEHFGYEVEMMIETYNKIESYKDNTTIKNALIESFVIHARSIDEFFRARSQRTRIDDVVVSDIVSGYIVSNNLNRGLRSKMNQQIAHMTLGRTIVPEDKIGDKERKEIIDTIIDELKIFRSALPDNLREILISIDGHISVPTERSATNVVSIASTSPNFPVDSTGTLGPTGPISS